jgi:hypothetical protein
LYDRRNVREDAILFSLDMLMPVDRARSFVLTLVLIYGPTSIFLALTVVFSNYGDFPTAIFSRDPTSTMKVHPLTGMQSNLGILVWWAAAAICFFGHAVLRYSHSDATLRSFLLWSGVITAVLALDDFFLVHDDLVLRYLKLSETPVLLSYTALLVWHLVRFRRHILRSSYLLLLLALMFFGLSIVVDFFQEHWLSPWRIFLEDGFKLLGIVSWSGYLIQCAFHACAARAAVLEGRAGASGPGLNRG